MKKMYISLMLLFFTQYCWCMLKDGSSTSRTPFEDERISLVTGTILPYEPHSRSTVISPRDESDSEIPTVIPLSPPQTPVRHVSSYSQERLASYQRIGCLASGVLGIMGLIGLIIEQALHQTT